jgi:hypothetical protein
MKRSDRLRERALRFYDRFSANDAQSFDELVSQQATSIIGTAEDEWFTDREKLRSGFGYDGLRLEGGDPEAWEEGDIGWVVDRPTMQVPGHGEFRTRFTGVFRREDGVWRLVLSHFSVGVPDEEVVELQRRFPA